MMLAHYYHKKELPFRSLSVLSPEEALTIMTQLQAKQGTVYRRFQKPSKYLEAKITTEKWLKEELIIKGKGGSLKKRENTIYLSKLKFGMSKQF